MQQHPPPVSTYVHTHFITPRLPAYLLVDTSGRLLNWGGELTSYGMTELQSGQAITERFPALTGLFPISELPLFLPWIDLGTGLIADLHLFAGDEGVWVLLLDATSEATMHSALQQRVNALSLLCAQQTGMVEQYRILHDALDTLGFQGAMIHQNHTICFTTTTLAKLFGYDSTAELLGQRLQLLMPSMEHECPSASMSPGTPGFSPENRTEWQGRRKDGTLFWVEAMATPVSWRKQPATLVVVHDITERKRLDMQFLHVQKMATMGFLTGGIVHDFNNILTAILGYTELALRTAPQVGKAHGYLQAVLGAGERARDLIFQLLTFLRNNSPERHPLQPYYLIKEALTMLRATLPATIAIRQRLVRHAGTVMANPTQLYQVLLNLCTNAAHAMRDTGGELFIGIDGVEVDAEFAMVHPRLRPGSYVRLTVQDTGHGIPPEVMQHMFTPFFTTKGFGEGTGLGLRTVQNIVTSHGGAIEVMSMPGEGTTFEVYLPCIDTPTTQPSPVAPEGPGSLARILVVDDEPMLARLGKEVLTSIGHEVVVCLSGQEALEVFQASPERFDLVIADQTMPDMTGDILTRELRRRRADIPIILCTGFSPTLTPHTITALGIQTLLTKPIRMAELAQTIQHVLRHPSIVA